jgi:hypothetical protein
MRVLFLAGVLVCVGCPSTEAPPPPQVPTEVEASVGEQNGAPPWFARALGDNAAPRWKGLSPQERVAWARAVIQEGALEPPGMDSEGDTFQAVVSGKSAGELKRAQEKVVAQVVGAVLADLSYASLAPKARASLAGALVDLLRDEAFEPVEGGSYRYSVRVSLEEARERVLDALQLNETLGAEEFILAVNPKGWFDGDGLEKRERELLGEVVAARCSQSLLRVRMRQARAASDKERVSRAAVDLGVEVDTAVTRRFADLFQAGWVVSVSGAIRFEPFAEGSSEAKGHYGYLRSEGLRVTVYSRKLDLLIVQFGLSSERSLRQPKKGSARRLHQPWLAKGGNLAEQVEDYAAAIGRSVGVNVARRLLQHYYQRK